MENPVIRNVENIEIEYDIDDGEAVLSKNNMILKELTLNVIESPYYVGEYEIVFFEGDNEIAKTDFTGSFKDDIKAIMNTLEEIALKIKE